MTDGEFVPLCAQIIRTPDAVGPACLVGKLTAVLVRKGVLQNDIYHYTKIATEYLSRTSTTSDERQIKTVVVRS